MSQDLSFLMKKGHAYALTCTYDRAISKMNTILKDEYGVEDSKLSHAIIAGDYDGAVELFPESKMHFIGKSEEDRVIYGPASVTIVDNEGDLVTGPSLVKSLPQLLKRRTLSLNHMDIVPGEIIESYETSTGNVYKTEVRSVTAEDIHTFDKLKKSGVKEGDTALFVVAKIYDDTNYSNQVWDDIKKGYLTSFSISGQATAESRKIDCEGFACKYVNSIDDMDISAVTVCKRGMNPAAGFTIVRKSWDDEPCCDDCADGEDCAEEAVETEEAPMIEKSMVSDDKMDAFVNNIMKRLDTMTENERQRSIDKINDRLSAVSKGHFVTDDGEDTEFPIGTPVYPKGPTVHVAHSELAATEPGSALSDMDDATSNPEYPAGSDRTKDSANEDVSTGTRPKGYETMGKALDDILEKTKHGKNRRTHADIITALGGEDVVKTEMTEKEPSDKQEEEVEDIIGGDLINKPTSPHTEEFDALCSKAVDDGYNDELGHLVAASLVAKEFTSNCGTCLRLKKKYINYYQYMEVMQKAVTMGKFYRRVLNPYDEASILKELPVVREIVHSMMAYKPEDEGTMGDDLMGGDDSELMMDAAPPMEDPMMEDPMVGDEAPPIADAPEVGLPDQPGEDNGMDEAFELEMEEDPLMPEEEGEEFDLIMDGDLPDDESGDLEMGELPMESEMVPPMGDPTMEDPMAPMGEEEQYPYDDIKDVDVAELVPEDKEESQAIIDSKYVDDSDEDDEDDIEKVWEVYMD